jgi:hypothetical protein
MYFNMKALIYLFFLIALVSSACKSTSPTQLPTYTIPPTNTFGPTKEPTMNSEELLTTTPAPSPSIAPAAPAFLEFYYNEQTCAIDVPNRFTTMRCYSINPDWFSLGLFAYSGDTIDFISVSHFVDAPPFIVKQSRKFVTDTALFAGWNMNDLRDAMEGINNSPEMEWISYNTIDAKYYLTPETNVIVYGFERIP